VRNETVINNNTIEQINTFSCLGCPIISHQNEKDITVKTSKFLHMREIINRTLKPFKGQQHIRMCVCVCVCVRHFGITYFIIRMRNFGNYRTRYIQDNFRDNEIYEDNGKIHTTRLQNQ
jgi:hypothetical protein